MTEVELKAETDGAVIWSWCNKFNAEIVCGTRSNSKHLCEQKLINYSRVIIVLWP